MALLFVLISSCYTNVLIIIGGTNCRQMLVEVTPDGYNLINNVTTVMELCDEKSCLRLKNSTIIFFLLLYIGIEFPLIFSNFFSFAFLSICLVSFINRMSYSSLELGGFGLYRIYLYINECI